MRIRGKLFFATKIIVLGIGAATSNISRIFLYWVVFFCICFGLGFPVLNRFDPKTGSPDSISYYKLVTGRPSEAGDLLRYRVLVPWVAKPFFWAGDHHLGSWSPVAFGLLMSNSLFTATAALFLLMIGTACVSHKTALAGVLLFLLNFTIPNRQLGSGLVESGESCCMLMLFCALLQRKFFLLPIIGLLGALAKESFVPISATATLGWAIYEFRRGTWKLSATIWSVFMVLTGLSTVVLLQWSVTGHLIWPWAFARSLRDTQVDLLTGLARCFTAHYFWYVFGWLLPLGVVRLRAVPAAWVWASAGGAAAALSMGAWNNAAGDTIPSVFNSVGPVLSLSAAQLLLDWAAKALEPTTS
jgi:hypothetical protein